MSRAASLLSATALLLALTGAALGQRAEPLKTDDLPKDYRWEAVAKDHKLDDKDLGLLRINKFVITGSSHKQIFQPYVSSEVPVFVTTDSLLNAYHVLFEESIYRLELANSRKLPGILDAIAKNLDPAHKALKGDPKLLAAAHRRAAIFLGTARRLLDDKALPEDADLRALVQKEAERITAGTANEKPAWLGPPDDGFTAIDYSRFKPRGFYAKTPALERYFRAVSWLQAIPFRLDNDEELTAILLLHRAFHDPASKEEPKGADFWRTFGAFLGTGDEWDLLAANRFPEEFSGDGLFAVRREYRKAADGDSRAQINDQLRFAPTDGKPEIGFRFLPSFRLPDAVLFQRTMRGEVEKHDFPTGLEVSAALGSSFARDALAKDHPKVLKEIDAGRPLFKEKSQYAQYLQCLAILLERTEPDAPAFLKEEAWKAKTCQTALASWAQMRHTWALQAKQGANSLSASRCDPGFVEPVPEFYGRMARLVEANCKALDKAGALAPTDWKELGRAADEAQRIVERLRKEKKGLDSLSADEQALLAQFDPSLNEVFDAPGQASKVKDPLQSLEGVLHWYRLVGQGSEHERKVFFEMAGFEDNFRGNWTKLAEMCHRLEVMAHKQLRQVPFSDEENEFLQHYGKELGHLMFYGGNSYYTPRDDAPRVIDVFTNPSVKKHLSVGTGRARELWVLYPVKGVDVLCRGAVLPYYEFTRSERLTDADWKALLDSPQRPRQPAWVQGVTIPEKAAKPEKDK